MNDEAYEKSDADDLMNVIADKDVQHLRKQQRIHQDIHYQSQLLFGHMGHSPL
jgi:hypothetical protein